MFRCVHLGCLVMMLIPAEILSMPTFIAMVKPWDQVLLTGGDIVTNCTLYSDEAASTEGLYFKLVKDGITKTFAPTSHLPGTAQLRVVNATPEDAGMYFCFYDPTGGMDGTRASIFSSYVQVGTPPLPAQATCRVDNSVLGCEWCEGYMDPWVTYTMLWSTSDDSTIRRCNNYGFDRCNCTIEGYDSGLQYNVTIIGRNDFGESQSTISFPAGDTRPKIQSSDGKIRSTTPFPAPPLPAQPTCSVDNSVLGCEWCEGYMNPWVTYTMLWSTSDDSTIRRCNNYGFDRCNCTIEGYDSGLQYNVTIIGRNDFGESQSTISFPAGDTRPKIPSSDGKIRSTTPFPDVKLEQHV